ncbi:DUF2306 domain-containing protein [Nostocoides sp. Soil756]|jgi:uncharacterized membrane protein|uniref:DUF2306 domain-containing protein n=1 Tax=Nostocoides sp. Soil756 TaxID=1736399 RepID=UPI0006FEEE3E|nr:DUF2306 domain-containing protein [Tetrasphaera sp. Soil756]KRE62189.1 hypothetical protein ASG78_03815 [Tetrasphaera sp. Soil756]
MHAWTLLIATHVVAALVSVALGVVQLARHKGDARHRLLGRVWVGLMLWTAVSSFWIRHLRDGAFSWLHILSLVTLVTVTLGVLAVRRGDLRAHRGNMVGSWLGSAVAMVFALAVPTRMIPTFALDRPGGALAAAAALAVATAVLVVAGDRLATRGAARRGGPAAGHGTSGASRA